MAYDGNLELALVGRVRGALLVEDPPREGCARP
jgi:hypothetical protein